MEEIELKTQPKYIVLNKIIIITISFSSEFYGKKSPYPVVDNVTTQK